MSTELIQAACYGLYIRYGTPRTDAKRKPQNVKCKVQNAK